MVKLGEKGEKRNGEIGKRYKDGANFYEARRKVGTMKWD